MYNEVMFVNSPVGNKKQDLVSDLRRHGIDHLCDIKHISRLIELSVSLGPPYIEDRGSTAGKGSAAIMFFKVTFFDEKAHLLFRLSMIDDRSYKICNPNQDMLAFNKTSFFKVLDYTDSEQE